MAKIKNRFDAIKTQKTIKGKFMPPKIPVTGLIIPLVKYTGSM
jgi:hypothetical protein